MTFISTYKKIKKSFIKKKKFTELVGSNQKFSWPDTSGVYVIWRKSDEQVRNLIYIGMTGKFFRSAPGVVSFNNGSFKSRTARWTPYRFCESEKDGDLRFSFRYGPKHSSVADQLGVKYDSDGYSNTLPYSDLVIHCFHIDAEDADFSPTYIESLLLNSYLKEQHDLPPANNEL